MKELTQVAGGLRYMAREIEHDVEKSGLTFEAEDYMKALHAGDFWYVTTLKHRHDVLIQAAEIVEGQAEYPKDDILIQAPVTSEGE